jgi:hypothetical protein
LSQYQSAAGDGKRELDDLSCVALGIPNFRNTKLRFETFAARSLSRDRDIAPFSHPAARRRRSDIWMTQRIISTLNVAAVLT